MTISNKGKTSLILKNIIRVLLLEYSLDYAIFNINALTQNLTDIIWKALINCNLYTPERLHILIIFFENKLVRGAIFPNTTLQIILETVEILESIARPENTNNILTKELFL
jgi:hypothetical protein